VIALGGNAILQPGQEGTAAEQRQNVEDTCERIAALYEQGYEVVLTHGNGPQVGSILLQNEAGRGQVPAMPLDICGAESQGLIGYMMQQSLRNALARKGLETSVATVVCQSLVDADDPAFANPTKPIGPFYSEDEAKELAESKGYQMKEDAGRGWRRVVPSPDPKAIVEKEAICSLVEAGAIVISSGGGGIPVVREGESLKGVEAVIDKDLAGERLARDVEADVFLILTDVERAALNYGTDEEESLARMNVEQAKRYLEEGHFKPGSMGPKVKAALRFASSRPDRKCIITSLDKVSEALRGQAGTLVTAV